MTQIDLESFGQFIQKLVREELEKFSNTQNHGNEKNSILVRKPPNC